MWPVKKSFAQFPLREKCSWISLLIESIKEGMRASSAYEFDTWTELRSFLDGYNLFQFCFYLCNFPLSFRNLCFLIIKYVLIDKGAFWLHSSCLRTYPIMTIIIHCIHTLNASNRLTSYGLFSLSLQPTD